MSARKKLTPERLHAAAQAAALMRDYEALPRNQQWTFLIKALNHYADGMKYPAKPQEPSQAEVAA